MRWFVLLITFLCWSKDSLSDSNCVNYLQDVSIIHPEVKVDLDVLHSVGQKVFAYISVGEVTDDASYRKTVQDLEVRALTRNPIWNSDIVDLSDPRWRCIHCRTTGPRLCLERILWFLSGYHGVCRNCFSGRTRKAG